MRAFGSMLVVALVCGLPLAANADPITITSDRRIIDMQGGASVGGTNIGDGALATDAKSDTLSDSISIQAGPLSGSASASLFSTIENAARMSGTATTSATSLNPGPDGNNNSIGLLSLSDFDVTFSLAALYTYNFDSTYTTTSTAGGPGADARTFYFAQLAFFPGSPIFNINATSPDSFVQTGNLPAGEYSLIVQIEDFVGGSSSTRSGFNFTFNLDPVSASPTPEPASLLLLSTAVGGVLLRRFKNGYPIFG